GPRQLSAAGRSGMPLAAERLALSRKRPFDFGGRGMREWVLAEQNHAGVRARRWEAAVLPFGATEPHSLHMPYGTDNFQVEELGRRACGWAWQAGGRDALLPTVPYGVNTNHLQIPGALACSVTPTTLLALLTDLVDSLERQGVR